MPYPLNIKTDKWAHFAWSYILVHTPATLIDRPLLCAAVALSIGLIKEVWDWSHYKRDLQDAVGDIAADTLGVSAGLIMYWVG